MSDLTKQDNLIENLINQTENITLDNNNYEILGKYKLKTKIDAQKIYYLSKISGYNVIIYSENDDYIIERVFHKIENELLIQKIEIAQVLLGICMSG